MSVPAAACLCLSAGLPHFWSPWQGGPDRWQRSWPARARHFLLGTACSGGATLSAGLISLGALTAEIEGP